MRTVFKYPLEIASRQTVAIPSGAVFLSLRMQREVPTIWMLVDPEGPTQDVVVKMYGTGEALENVGPYVGTVESDYFTWHFFIEAPLIQ